MSSRKPHETYSYSQVRSGEYLDILRPDPSQLFLFDIAHSLSGQLRFNGHTREPVTIAAHSIHVMLLAQRYDMEAVRWGLVHDFKEYVIGDHTTPQKTAIRELIKEATGQEFDPVREMGNRFDKALFEWLEWEPSQDTIDKVKICDAEAMKWEVKAYWDFSKAGDWKLDGYETPMFLPKVRDDMGLSHLSHLTPTTIERSPAEHLMACTLTLFPIIGTKGAVINPKMAEHGVR